MPKIYTLKGDLKDASKKEEKKDKPKKPKAKRA